MTEYLGYSLVTVGVILNFMAALAVIRFPDIYTRLLGSTKFVTLGIASIMLGVFVILGLSATGVKALLCMLFVLLTSPVEAHALSRAARLMGISPSVRTTGGDAKTTGKKTP